MSEEGDGRREVTVKVLTRKGRHDKCNPSLTLPCLLLLTRSSMVASHLPRVSPLMQRTKAQRREERRGRDRWGEGRQWRRKVEQL